MPLVVHARRPLARRGAPARLAALGPDTFEGYASLFGVADGAGDIVARGAFANTLRKRGAENIRMLWQHFAHEPIGVWEDIREDARGLYVRGRLTTHADRARDVRALIADGAVNGLSIGFRTVRAERNARAATRTLLDLELWEVSVVTFPLLEGSHVTAIGEKASLDSTIRAAASAFRNSPLLSSPANLAERGEGRGTSARSPSQ